jgi:hypothetical protein
MRVSEGTFLAKKDRNGRYYYLHRLTATSGMDGSAFGSTGPTSATADVNRLQQLCAALLDPHCLSSPQREAAKRFLREFIRFIDAILQDKRLAGNNSKIVDNCLEVTSSRGTV